MRNSLRMSALAMLAMVGSSLGTPSQRLSGEPTQKRRLQQPVNHYKPRYPFSSAKQHAKQARQRMVVVNGFEIMNTIKGK